MMDDRRRRDVDGCGQTMRGICVEKEANRDENPPRQHQKNICSVFLKIYVDRYFQKYASRNLEKQLTDIPKQIFFSDMLYVYKDSEKRIKLERKTNIRKKKDGARHIVQVRRGRSIQK